MNIPTAHSLGSVERFLQHVQIAPIPQKVTRAYLKDSGFTSGNDPELRHIFRILGFLNEDDRPIERWMEYKEKGRDVLKEAVVHIYKDLFAIFPDAPKRSESELLVWFRSPITGEARSAVERAIRTFRKLCQLSGIDSEQVEKKALSHMIQEVRKPSLSVGSSWSNSINIQVPNFKDQDDYVRFFEAIKKVFYE